MAVRSESVRLSLEDAGFTSGMAKAAAATALLEARLQQLDGANVNVSNGTRTLGSDLDGLSKSSQRANSDINQLTGRLALMAQLTATLGPGLVPIASVGVPAIAGLSTGLAAAALGGASLIASLQGVGEATKAVDAYKLDPTVETYERARVAIGALSPAAQKFVADFQGFQPVLTSLRDASAEGWMPGLSESLDNLTDLAPRARDLLLDVSKAGGEALADSTASLASDRWDDFYDLIDRQAPEAITTLTNVVGNLTHGVAELMVSAEPGSNAFMGWIDDAANGFDRWASSDKGREDVRAFLDYAATNGPKVSAFFGSLVDTVASIAQAAAPLGGTVLTTLTAVSDVIGKIADSDLGTPLLVAAAGMSAFSRAAKLTDTIAGSTFVTKRFPDGIRAAGAEARAGVPRFRDFGSALLYAAHSNDTLTKAQQSGSKVSAASATNALRARQAVVDWGRGAASAGVPIAALGLLATGTADNIGITNTAAGAMIGTLAGPWGTAFGAAGGAVLDLSNHLTGDLSTAIDRANTAAAGGNIPQMRAELKNLSAEFTDTSVGARIFDEVLNTATVGQAGGKYRKAAAEVLELNEALRKAKEEPFDPSVIGSPGNGLDLLANGLELTAQQFDNARIAGSNFFDMVGSAGKVLDRRGQWRAYQAAIDGASAALEQNGKTLDNNSAAGRANNDALDQMGASALTFAQNLKGADRVDFLKGARDGIQRAAHDFGLGQAAARRLANSIIGVGNLKVRPGVGLDDSGFKQGQGRVKKGLGAMNGSSANPWVDLYDDPFQHVMGKTKAAIRALNAARANPVVNLNDQATGRAQGIQAVIDNITGKTVYITTVHRDVRVAAPQGVAANPTLNANGGIHVNGTRAFADGGYGVNGRYYPRVPQIVPGGANILWGEQETGREAYISDKPGMESRNLEILTRAADWFGATVETYASGGARDGRRGGNQRQRLSPDARQAIAEVREILAPINREFRRDLKKADDRGERLDAFRDRLKASTEALKTETQQRKKVIDDMRSFASEVTGAYRHDIFGNGLAGLQVQLKADENDARTAMSNLGQARKNGLDGALLEALQRSGDTNTISQVSALDRAGIAALERQYASSMATTGALGNQAAQIKYGVALADSARTNRLLERAVGELRADLRQLGNRVQRGAEVGSSRGAHAGTARGARDNDRAATRGTRAQGRGGGRRSR